MFAVRNRLPEFARGSVYPITCGDVIPADFDSMIAKIIAWGQDREEALARLRRALAQSTVVVEGGTTNRSFLVGLLDRPELTSGDFDNRWLDKLTAAGEHVPAAQPVALLAAAVEAYASDHAAAQAAFQPVYRLDYSVFRPKGYP